MKEIDNLDELVGKVDNAEEKIEDIVKDIPTDDMFIEPDIAENANKRVHESFIFEQQYKDKLLKKKMMKQLVFENVFAASLEEYRKEHGYEMSGPIKRKIKKSILRNIEKGRIKVPEYTDLNA